MDNKSVRISLVGSIESMIATDVLKLHLRQTHILRFLGRLHNVLPHLYHLLGVVSLGECLFAARFLQHLQLETHECVACTMRFLYALRLLLLQLGLVVILYLIKDDIFCLLYVDFVAQVLPLLVHFDHLLVVLPLYRPPLHHLLQLPYFGLQDVQLLVPNPFETLQFLPVGLLHLTNFPQPYLPVFPQLRNRKVPVLKRILERQFLFLCLGDLCADGCDPLLEIADLGEQLAPGHHVILDL